MDLAALADAADGLNGAELAALCQRAKMLAIEASVADQPGQDFTPFAIEARHFATALQTVGRTLGDHGNEKIERRAG